MRWTRSIRRSLTVTALVILIAAASASAGATEAQVRRRQPNVLFLMCDQLTARALSCYGGPVSTPHIDRLAREGVRFTQATCTTPFCSPSRASIVTGMYPHAHGIVANCAPRRQRGLDDSDITTGKLLSQAGYATHHYGKWHLFGERPACYPDMFCPNQQYVEEMAEVFASVRRTDPAGWMDWYLWALPVDISPPFADAVRRLGDRWKDEKHGEFITSMGRLKLPPDQYYDVRLGDLATPRVAALGDQDKPFMVTCSFNGPHDPNVVPSPYYERFDPSRIELPANRHVREPRFEREWSRRIVADLGEPGLREFLRIYYGCIRLIDDQVGRILRSLEESGVLDNTIIVFTADHGDMAGGHDMVWKSTSAFYDEIVVVPLLIRYPRRLAPRRCELAVDFTDLMPTLLELAGRPIPEQVQGQNLVPFLTGRRPESQARQFTFSERVRPNPDGSRKAPFSPKGASFMVRGEGLKYIRYGPKEEYLYDLSNDPGETRNLIRDERYVGRRAKLAAELARWLERTAWRS